jgi:hypothetical protein
MINLKTKKCSVCKGSTGGRLDWGFFDHEAIVNYTGLDVAIVLSICSSIAYIVPIWGYLWVSEGWIQAWLCVVLWGLSVIVGWSYYRDVTTLWPQYYGSFFCFLAAFIISLSIPTIVRDFGIKTPWILHMTDFIIVVAMIGLGLEYWYVGKYTCLNFLI